MPKIQRFDHVAVTVADLEAAIAFFVDLGLEVEGRTFVDGAFIETVTGIPDARSEIAMLRLPGGGTAIELARFVHPNPEPGQPGAPANVLGIRKLGFEVDDLAPILARLAARGFDLVGGVGEYEGVWRMAHVRGPEGIVVSLAQRLG
jgi:catechol 2,3-dioxygenase-like lactoylglutathione lyase family enzyme